MCVLFSSLSSTLTGSTCQTLGADGRDLAVKP
jgi:hypothetical protein